jgi:hypothetical protein
MALEIVWRNPPLLQGPATVLCAVKGAGQQWVEVQPGNWIAQPGSNRYVRCCPVGTEARESGRSFPEVFEYSEFSREALACQFHCEGSNEQILVWSHKPAVKCRIGLCRKL